MLPYKSQLTPLASNNKEMQEVTKKKFGKRDFGSEGKYSQKSSEIDLK